MKRAYSILTIKAVDDDLRIIEGIASTPSTDRMGDIVQPKGAQFKLPIPLLWQHDSAQPIGQVISATANDDGIAIRAQIAKGVLPQIDDAWALIKAGLVRGLSIGFIALDAEQIPNSWGLNIKTWDWLELSCVTIPANAEASIQAVKSADAKFLRSKASSDWRVGAARDLPIDTSTAWDGPAAAERILDAAGFNGDNPNSAQARRGFLVYDAGNPTLKGSYKLPFADLFGGSLKAVEGGLRAAASRLPQTDIPDAAQTEARAVLDAYFARINDDSGKSAQAATGHKGTKPPGVTGQSKKPVKLTPKEGKAMKKTIAEQISAFEATRQAKAARMEAIMDEAAEKGETLDAAQTEEYDGLKGEVDAIDAHLTRLKAMETAQAKTAKSIQAQVNVAVASGTVVKMQPKSAPGIRFARLAKVKALATIQRKSVIATAERVYGADSETAMLAKAAVDAGTTLSGNWATDLVGTDTSAFADFAEFLRPTTILGKFGVGNVPALRRVPFRVPLVGQTGGGQGYWVGEGKPKPLTAFDFSRTTLNPLKVANIAVLTMELIRDSSPSAEVIIRDQIAAALRERLDTDFVDPAKAASAGVSPASITNGVSPIGSSGNDADGVRADIRALFGAFIAANNAPTSGVWIMPATVALALSLMQNPLGQAEFPGISMNGGLLFGLPVIVSEYVPTVTAGAYVVLINASDIYNADDGDVAVDISMEASLEMKDGSLTQDATSGTGTSLVSLWQTNSVGFRAERTINWAARRASAVQVLDAVNWGQPSS